MIQELPPRALFRFELPIHYVARPPRIDGDASKWPDRYRVPPLCAIDGQEPFADVCWAWNEDGFYAAFDVRGRTRPPQVDTTYWWKKDGLRLCIDTRDARDVRRATRFCRFFYLLPTGGGPRQKDPIVGVHRMSRAKEPAPPIDLSLVRRAAQIDRDGYRMEVAIPAACLTGWDPVEHPRIGAFYKIKDVGRGSQSLTVTDDLGWNVDPSTWATGVLVR